MGGGRQTGSLFLYMSVYTFQGRRKQAYYSNSIRCHWSYYKLLSPSANWSGGGGLLKSMCDGQKRHKRKENWFHSQCFFFHALQTSAKRRRSLKNLLSCEKYFGKKISGFIPPGRESVPTESRRFFLRPPHFPFSPHRLYAGGGEIKTQRQKETRRGRR